MGLLVHLPAGRLEENGRAHAAMYVPASMATSRRISPSWPRTTARKSGTSKGADPSVISGSVRALLNCSGAAQEIHWASMARAPRVCWNWGRARHLR